MNVLYIVPSSFEDLKKKGVVDLIKQRDEGGFFKKVITLHPFTKKNNIIYLDDKFKIIEYGWQTGIDFLDKLPITKFFGALIVIFKLLFVFPFIIKKEKIDVIRATDPYLMGLLGWYYSKIFKIPLIVSIHSDYDLADKNKGYTFKILGSRKFAKFLERIVLKSSTHILTISEYLKNKILSNINNENKISIYPHGLDLNSFTNCKYIDIYSIYNLDTRKKIISYVARLSKEKYCYDIISIAELLFKQRDDFVILIVGDGKERKEMEKLVSQKGLSEVIKFLGFQKKEIVSNIRKQSFLSISLLDGFSLIEACAAGRPVIAYDVEWHYELVKDGKTGFLVEEGNVKKVVEKIEFLFKNPDIANKMGQEAKNLAYKRHNLENVIKLKQKILLNILKNERDGKYEK